jgi:hypothetical protein
MKLKAWRANTRRTPGPNNTRGIGSSWQRKSLGMAGTREPKPGLRRMGMIKPLLSTVALATTVATVAAFAEDVNSPPAPVQPPGPPLTTPAVPVPATAPNAPAPGPAPSAPALAPSPVKSAPARVPQTQTPAPKSATSSTSMRHHFRHWNYYRRHYAPYHVRHPLEERDQGPRN